MNGSEDFLVIACDGLWDTVSPSAATALVYSQIKSNKGKLHRIAVLSEEFYLLDHAFSNTLNYVIRIWCQPIELNVAIDDLFLEFSNRSIWNSGHYKKVFFSRCKLHKNYANIVQNSIFSCPWLWVLFCILLPSNERVSRQNVKPKASKSKHILLCLVICSTAF